MAVGLLLRGIAVAMSVAAGIIVKWPEPWNHRILILEMVEIGLFASMWVVQSVERWGRIVTTKP